MSTDLRPQHGARFELDLLEPTDGGGARYRARVHLPAGTIDYALSMNGDGACSLASLAQPAAATAPPWAEAQLLALGRLLFREARPKGGPPGDFRRHLLRWRPESQP